MSNKPITLFEHDPFGIIENGISLSRTDIDNIRRLNQSIKKKYNTSADLIRLWPDGYEPTHLIATSFVGVVKAGRNTIQILRGAGWTVGQMQ